MVWPRVRADSWPSRVRSRMYSRRENINFFGFITVDIEAELAKLIEGWRPLRPTRVHDAGLPFLLNP